MVYVPMFHVKHSTIERSDTMTGTTARKITSYLRKHKCGLIKVRTMWDKELETWTVVIINEYSQEIYQWCGVNRDSFRRMRILAKSVINW